MPARGIPCGAPVNPEDACALRSHFPFCAIGWPLIQATPIDRLTLGERLQQFLRRIALGFQMALAGYLLLCLVSYQPEDPGWSHLGFQEQIQNLGGPWGAWFADLALSLFGYPAFLFPLAVFWSGYLLFGNHGALPEIRIQRFILCWIGFFSVLAATSTLAEAFRSHLPDIWLNGPGGGLGQWFHHQLDFLREAQRFLVFLLAFALGLPLFFGRSWLTAVDLLGDFVLRAGELFFQSKPKAQVPEDRASRLGTSPMTQESRESGPEPLASPPESGASHDASRSSETHPTHSDTQPM